MLLVSFRIASLVFFAASFVYYYDERSRLHRQTNEQIYWSLLYAWIAFATIRCYDSPAEYFFGWMGFWTEHSWRNWVIVVLAAGFGFRKKKKRDGVRLRSSMQQRRIEEFPNASPHEVKWQGLIAVSKISALLSMSVWQRISHSSKKCFPTGVLSKNSAIKSMPLWLSIYRSVKKIEVLDALKEIYTSGDGEEEGHLSLQFVLNAWEIDLPRLIATSNSETIEFLREKASRLDVLTKAKLIDALQRQLDFSFSTTLQEAVVDIFLTAKGSELTDLKSIMDEGGDVYNLHKLVFRDLQDSLREKVVHHISDEAKNCSGPCKILSDIDDTLYSSGGHFPAGADHRLRKGVVYPGVLKLFYEIDRYSHDESSPRTSFKSSSVWFKKGATQWQKETFEGSETVAQLRDRLYALQEDFARTGKTNSEFKSNSEFQLELNDAIISFTPQPPARVMSNLVFLSARPHAYKEYAEAKSYKLFQHLCSQKKLHCMPTLLAGKLRSSSIAALEGAVIKYERQLPSILVVSLLVGLVYQMLFISVMVFVALLFFAYGVYRNRGRSLPYVWQPVGIAKTNAYREYQSLYPECKTVFFGDNGQGDLLCAEKILEGESKKYDSFQGAFIHEVIPMNEQLTSFQDSEESSDMHKLPRWERRKKRYARWEEKNIFFFRTYVGAAVQACKQELISVEGLSRVGKAAVNEMTQFIMSECVIPEHQGKFVDDMNADVEDANELLNDRAFSSWVSNSSAMQQELQIPLVGQSLRNGEWRQISRASPSLQNLNDSFK